MIIESSKMYCRNTNWLNYYKKLDGGSSYKIKTRHWFDPTIPVLGVHTKNSSALDMHTCLSQLISPKIWKQPINE